MNALVPIQKPEDQPDDWTFDWRTDPAIVCEEQPALAVYENPRGQCVIRQERRWHEDGDTVILVCRENALRVAQAILAAAGMSDIEFVRPCGGGYENVPIDTPVPPCDASKPKDPTAAERQRRRRAKLKLEAAGQSCAYCGDSEGPFHRDHIVPLARGGSDDDTNRVTACSICNQEKGERTPVEWLEWRASFNGNPNDAKLFRRTLLIGECDHLPAVTRDSVTEQEPLRLVAAE